MSSNTKAPALDLSLERPSLNDDKMNMATALRICDVLLHCKGASAAPSSVAGAAAAAAGASWSVSSATPLTSERAESAGASAGGGDASDNVTVSSVGGEVSECDGWGRTGVSLRVEEGKRAGGKRE